MNFWNFYWPILKILIPVVIFGIIIKLITENIFKKKTNKPYAIQQPTIPLKSYKVITYLLTPAEQHLYKRLSELTNNRYLIFSKVRLTDILYSPSRVFDPETATKHIDFILCDPVNFSIKAGIELDDSTHNNEKAQNKDEFKNQLFKQIQIPLVRILPGEPTNQIKNKIERELKIRL